MARDYKAEYERRKARSQARGYTSPRTEQNARRAARGRPARDYALERENQQRRAFNAGLDSVKEFQSYQRAKKQGEAAEKKWTLDYFGLTQSQFDRMRRANRHYTNQYAQLQWTAINTYDLDRDKAVHDWSPMRVGYIKYFNEAIVNPATNYDSLKDNPRYYKGGPFSRKEMNKSQYYYLVRYTNLYQVDEFEARYGRVR
jgi:hypothetical protein